MNCALLAEEYTGTWDGAPLGSNDYVICADEKTSIQARCRRHPSPAPGKARAMRIEHDHRRGGARSTWPPGTSAAGRSPRDPGMITLTAEEVDRAAAARLSYDAPGS
jgi:hypothetical protein